MRIAITLLAAAGVAAAIACPGRALPEVELPQPSNRSKPRAFPGLVLSGEWHRLHRVEYNFHEGSSFWASAPDDFSFLLTDSLSAYQQAAVLELRSENGRATWQEIFSHESNTAPQPRHLPDGTAFVDDFVHIGGDFNKTFWLDLDRSAHFIINCIQGYWTGRPVVLPDGKVRSLFTLYPCSAKTTDDGTYCPRGMSVTTAPGTKPSLQCVFNQAYTTHPNHWHQSEDGLRAIGIGHYRGTLMEATFHADGGFEGGRILKTAPFSQLGYWLPVDREDGGTALVASTKRQDENKYAQRDVRLIYESPGHPEANDAGVVAELLPHLPLDSAPRVSHFVRPPVKHRGAWVWIVDEPTQWKLHLFNPQTLELTTTDAPMAPTQVGGRTSHLHQLHSDGTHLYVLQHVMGHPEDEPAQEWWVRIIDEWDDYFAQTEAANAPPP